MTHGERRARAYNGGVGPPPLKLFSIQTSINRKGEIGNILCILKCRKPRLIFRHVSKSEDVASDNISIQFIHRTTILVDY